MKLIISEELKRKGLTINLGVVSADVVVLAESPELWQKIEAFTEEIRKNVKIEEVIKIQAINTTKKAYKKTGKDPNRYRPSAESLYRRILKNQALYKINNVINILNYVSLKSGFSIGGYDSDKIIGDIYFDIGKENEEYFGIGRGKLNIAGLPVFRDEYGAFGSPTSDSQRTAVGLSTTNFLMLIISFQGISALESLCRETMELLRKYAHAKAPDFFII